MGDEVGVDPPRLAQAASALEHLRDTLAANVPTIVNTMNMYWSAGDGSPISLAVLQQAQSRSVDDATDMRTRSSLAEAWLQQKTSLAGNGRVNIPWGSTAAEMQQVDSLDATAEAKALAAAEAESKTDPKAARAEIEAIQADLADHAQSAKAGDPESAASMAWMTAFYTSGATAIANLGTALNEEDGAGTSTLSDQDKQILGTFADSLATVTSSGNLTAAQSQQLVSDFTLAASKDPWSAAMLLKAGPPGSAYGTAANGTGANLLAGVTEQVLNAYQNGGLNIPINLRTQPGENIPSNSEVNAAVAANDPLAAMLTLDTQNNTAAQEVMAGFDPVTQKMSQSAGEQWASIIMNQATGSNIYTPVFSTNPQSGMTPYFKIMAGDGPPMGLGKGNQAGPEWDSYTMDSNIIGSFLDASTSAPRGTSLNAKFSAQAAVDMIVNTQPCNVSSGSVQASYPPPVLKALQDTFVRYMPDLAASAYPPTSPSNGIDDSNPSGAWEINITSGDLQNYLNELSYSPNASAMLQDAVGAKMGQAYALELQGAKVEGNTDVADQMAALYGLFNTVQGNLKYSAGTMEDAHNAEINSMISFVESQVNLIPVVGGDASKLLSYDQSLSFLGLPQIPQLSTDNAANAAQTAKANFSAAELDAMVPLVQGMVQQGIIQPDPSWYKNGQVVYNYQFYLWWKHAGNTVLQNKTVGTNTTLGSEYQRVIDAMGLQNQINSQTGS